MSKPAHDAIHQASLIRDGSLKASELLESTIERIERLNPIINAVITKTYNEAREKAEQKLPESPLSGIPILVKDQVSIKGVRITYGSTLFKNNVSTFDCEIIKRMKNSGMIILGVTNMPELGLTCTTEPRLYGPTRNPWNIDVSAGGSSGGSAAAVASGIVAIAHGSDGGGSIRTPASFCGVFGLKPTRGRVPFSPVSGSAFIGLSVQHALTRSVRDSAAFLDVIGYPCIGEPYWAPPKERSYLEEVRLDPGKLRIALLTKTIENADLHPDVEKVIRESGALCSELGHTVEDVNVSDIVDIDIRRFISSFLDVWHSGVGSTLNKVSMRSGMAPQRDWVEDLTWGMYLMSQRISSSDFILAQEVLEQFGRSLNGFLRRFDLLLTPTNPDPPFKLGWVNPSFEEPLKNFDRVVRVSSLTALSNAAGNPAMSVPLGKSKNGLPIGAQFVGRFGDEALLFRLASQLEKVKPWYYLSPNIS